MVGGRRSGTHLLQRLLAVHPLVTDIPTETHLFSYGIGQLVERFQSAGPGTPTVGKAYLPRDVMLDHLRELTSSVFQQYATEPNTRVLERTPEHVHHLDLIAELYPQARFVNIVRAGDDVVRSLVAQQWGPDDLATAAAEWRDAVLAGLGPHQRVTHLAHTRYELLLADPAAEMTRVFAALDLPVDATVLADVAAEASHRENTWGARKRPLGRAARRTLHRVAGDALALVDTLAVRDPGARPQPVQVGDPPATEATADAPVSTISSVHDAQHVVDHFLEVVSGDRPADDLRRLTVPGARFTAVLPSGTRTLRGTDAADTWLDLMRATPSTCWPVVESHPHPAQHLVAIVATHRDGDTAADHTTVCRLSGAGITEVFAYVSPPRPASNG